MQIKKLLAKLDYELLEGKIDTEVTALVYDSRKIRPGAIFVCIKGTVRDGHDFIPEMMERGAVAFVIERDDVELVEGYTYILVESTRKALAELAAAYFDYPAEKLKTIGITGTKGKTTTTYLVRSVLEFAGIKTGLIGTIKSIVGEEEIPSVNTTPESYVIQELFRRMVDAGIEVVVMEVSSQALMMHRVDGFIFDIGVFTNLEPDHIGVNEHKDFADYLYCKSLLFQKCRIGILNGDSKYLKAMLHGHTCEIKTFGFGENNDIQASEVQLVKQDGKLGVRYRVKTHREFEVEVNIPGLFSVYNSMAAIAIANCFSVDEEEIKSALNNTSVKGRVEIVPVPKEYTMIIDYAHNAMSLQSLLTTLKVYKPNRIFCLFGCGGNRSKSRRYEMGEVSSRLADITVVTSDNPRDEDPIDIIQDILIGVKRSDGDYVVVLDRKEAIKFCMENAQAGDVIVLAGKGHEDYQEIRGIKQPMDERELIAEIIKENPDIKI